MAKGGKAGKAARLDAIAADESGAPGAEAAKGSSAALLNALDRSPTHLLHRALQLALDAYAEEAGEGALTQRQYAVLVAAGALPLATQTDLVRATGIDRSTLADMIARMTAKGLLARERSAADARANTVGLTAEGREALESATPRVEAADARLLAALPAGKREAFIKALNALATARTAPSAEEDEAAQAKARRKEEKAAEKARKATRKKRRKKAGKAPDAQAAEVDPPATEDPTPSE